MKNTKESNAKKDIKNKKPNHGENLEELKM
jgi:hypothetical protein